MPKKSTAQRLWDLFAGDPSLSGTHEVPVQDGLKWKIRTTARTVKLPPSEALWEQHLAGKRPLGVIPIRPDSLCIWGCIDVDQYDANLLRLVEAVETAKLPLIPCRSKSGGLHLFAFLSEPEPAGALQSALRDIAARLGLAGSEIFPKQTQVLSDHGDQGNWMVMPYFGGTFDGKLHLQVGLKKTGAEQTVEEFLTAAEAARTSTATLTPPRPSRPSGGNGVAAPTGPFADGPCCLQHLVGAGGMDKGAGQSNALFMMALYYKRTDPDHWAERVDEANRLYMRPPCPPEEVQGVIRSAGKKEYHYTCKQEPMASHCNAAICRTRHFGVGEEGNYPTISGLSKLDTDPPLWFVDVDDIRVDATTEQLQQYSQFHKLCMERANRCYRAMAQKDWLVVVNAAMSNLTLIEAPFDIGRFGRFVEQLDEFLTNRMTGQTRGDLLRGVPWEDTEDTKDPRYWFRLTDLEAFLRRAGEREVVRGQLRSWVDKLGGGHSFFNVNGKGVNAWWVPAGAVQRAAPADLPEIPRDPI